MINFRNVIIFLFTAIILFNNQLCDAQASQGNDEDILDLIISIIAKKKCNTQSGADTLSCLANSSGISLNEIEHIHIAHYTAGFDTKTVCNHTSPWLGKDECDAWLGYTTYYRDQVCTWYLDAPTGSSIIMQVQAAKDAYNNLINDLVTYIKDRIKEAIETTLIESTVAATIAGFATYGSGAAPAFTSTFSSQIEVHLIEASQKIALYMQTIFVANSATLISSAFPVITGDNVHQTCDWSEWKSI